MAAATHAPLRCCLPQFLHDAIEAQPYCWGPATRFSFKRLPWRALTDSERVDIWFSWDEEDSQARTIAHAPASVRLFSYNNFSRTRPLATPSTTWSRNTESVHFDSCNLLPCFVVQPATNQTLNFTIANSRRFLPNRFLSSHIQNVWRKFFGQTILKKTYIQKVFFLEFVFIVWCAPFCLHKHPYWFS